MARSRKPAISYQWLPSGIPSPEGVTSRGSCWHPVGELRAVGGRSSGGDLFRGLNRAGEVEAFLVVSTHGLSRLPSGDSYSIADECSQHSELMAAARSHGHDWERLWRSLRADQLGVLAGIFRVERQLVVDVACDAVEEALRYHPEAPPFARGLLGAMRWWAAHGHLPSDYRQLNRWESEAMQAFSRFAYQQPGLAAVSLATFDLWRLPLSNAPDFPQYIGNIFERCASAVASRVRPAQGSAEELFAEARALQVTWAHSARAKLTLPTLCLALAKRHGRLV